MVTKVIQAPEALGGEPGWMNEIVEIKVDGGRLFKATSTSWVNGTVEEGRGLVAKSIGVALTFVADAKVPLRWGSVTRLEDRLRALTQVAG